MNVDGFSFADGGGGGTKAAHRLHASLRREGVNARLHVLRKQTSDHNVLPVTRHATLRGLASEMAPRIDQLPIRLLYPSADAFWSTGWYGAVDPLRLPGLKNADVICLYWVTRGLLGIREVERLLSTNKPIVWRLSDMWPFTGGCHYSGTCTRFQGTCGACPQLGSASQADLSTRLQRSKLKHWSDGNLTIIAPSHWMANKARASRLFRDRPISVIHTGVDCDKFRPRDRQSAREKLKLPQDRPLVLFGATGGFSDPRKGGDIVADVIRRVAECLQGSVAPGLVVYGTDERPAGIPSSVPIFSMGAVRDEDQLSLIYSACDVFFAPSREENLANSVLEALASGLPVLSSRVGGMPEAVLSGETGILSEPGDNDGLVVGLASLLDQQDRRESMSRNARALAEETFSSECQARAYIALFSKLSGRSDPDPI